MEMLSDGQHKHGEGGTLNCFFCVKQKRHCQYFRLTKGADDPPEYETLYNQRFVICPECSAKGPDFMAQHIAHWLDIQKTLSKHGVGLREIEDHKRTGKMPKLKKRKRR